MRIVPEAMRPPVSSKRIGSPLAAPLKPFRNSVSHGRFDLPGSRNAAAYGLAARSNSPERGWFVPLAAELELEFAGAAVGPGIPGPGRAAVTLGGLAGAPGLGWERKRAMCTPAAIITARQANRIKRFF